MKERAVEVTVTGFMGEEVKNIPKHPKVVGMASASTLLPQVPVLRLLASCEINQIVERIYKLAVL